MNYINQLQRENAQQRAQIDVMQDTIDAFRVHLMSDKFSSDPTIQVADVQRWLSSIIDNGLDAFFNPEKEIN